MLRALGTCRDARSLALFLGEAAALSAVGSAVGAAAGWLLAHARRRPHRDHGEHAVRGRPLRACPRWRGRTSCCRVSGGAVLSLSRPRAPALEASRVTPTRRRCASARSRSSRAYRVRTRHVVAGVGLLLVARRAVRGWVPSTSCRSSASSLPSRSCSASRSWCRVRCSLLSRASAAVRWAAVRRRRRAGARQPAGGDSRRRRLGCRAGGERCR